MGQEAVSDYIESSNTRHESIRPQSTSTKETRRVSSVPSCSVALNETKT